MTGKSFSSVRRVLRNIASVSLLTGAVGAGAQAYKVTNLVSDGSVTAAVMDTNFLNPWAMSSSGTWWISAANTGFNYVIPATTGAISFKVIVPLASQPTLPGLPAGSVTTSGSTGLLLSNGTAPNFLFSTLDGTISGWNSKLGTANAVSSIVINNSAQGAAYTGLALLNGTGGSFILAPNFNSGAVEVYDATYKTAKLAGSFTDPNLPAGYTPYAIHILGSQIFVTYAQRTATAPYRAVVAAGAGVVDVYDLTGNFTARAVTGGNLNAPWGVAIAPANFGIYSNDLLVGNFGDGKINVYDPKTYAYVGQLMDSNGTALAYASLWELLPGGTKVPNSTAVSGGDTSTVYFTAGLTNEAHGLLAGITNSVIAGAAPTYGFSGSAGSLTVKVGSSATIPLSVAPANGFSGTVSFVCAGLPVGAFCSFAPAPLNVSATAAASTVMTVTTTAASASAHSFLHSGAGGLLATAGLLPLGWLVRRRKRGDGRSGLLPFSLAWGFLAAGALLAGCGNSNSASSKNPLVTVPGTSQVIVTATSGSVAQQTAITLTVQ